MSLKAKVNAMTNEEIQKEIAVLEAKEPLSQIGSPPKPTVLALFAQLLLFLKTVVI